MNIWRTNQYTFSEEEKNTLSKAQTIFDTLSDCLLYSADDYYELDNFNLSQDDLDLIHNALTALTETSDVVTHDNIMTAD